MNVLKYSKLIVLLTSLLLVTCTPKSKESVVVTNKQFEIIDQMFNNTTIFIIDDNIERVITKLYQYDLYLNKSDFDNVVGYTFIPRHYPKTIIWLRNYEIDNIKDLSVAVHELTHLSNTTLRYNGIELSNQTEEVYAYHMDFLIEEFLKKIKW